MSASPGCAVGDDDDSLFGGPTSAATMYGSSGGEGDTSEVSGSAGTSSDAVSSDDGSSDASEGDGDASDATSSSQGEGSTADSTDASDASAGDTDPSEASTDATDATDSSDATSGDGDGDSDTSGGGAMCGNGAVESGEDCDDGNSSNSDGCSSACTWESNCGSDNPQPLIACGGQGNGNMNGAYSDVDEPVCGQTFAWQDRVYVYTAQDSGSVTATFTSSPDPGDGAIVVMEGSCHNQLCMASSLDSGNYHSVTWDAIAGLSYYIDLELPSQQPSFTLSLSCG